MSFDEAITDMLQRYVGSAVSYADLPDVPGTIIGRVYGDDHSYPATIYWPQDHEETRRNAQAFWKAQLNG